MFCNQCGKEIPDNSNFCVYCGAAQAVNLTAASPEPPVPETPLPSAEEVPAETDLPPVEATPVEAPQAPVEETPAEEAAPAPVEETPAEEAAPAPVEEAPAEEAPAAPVEEAPAEQPAPQPLPAYGPAANTPEPPKANPLPHYGPDGTPPAAPPSYGPGTPPPPAAGAPAAGGSSTSYDLLLKIFAAICGVVCLLRALGSLGGVFSQVFALVRYANIPSLFYMVLNMGSLVFYLAAAAMLALLALRRTKENTPALLFGLVAGAAGLLIVRVLNFVLSIVINVIHYHFFHYTMLLTFLGSLLGLAFWLALCVGGVWGILCLMKEAPQPAEVIDDPTAKLAVIAEALKKGAGEVHQQAGAAAASAKSAYDAHQAQQQAQAAQYQAAGGYPAVRIQTNRSLLAYILLSIVTCGIYSYYFIYTVARDVNEMCREDGEKTGGLLAFILLSIVTCGFYGLYWEYKLGNRLAANAPRYGIVFQENGTSVLLWYLVGMFLCGIGPFVAMHILIKNTNALAAAYNARNGL